MSRGSKKNKNNAQKLLFPCIASWRRWSTRPRSYHFVSVKRVSFKKETSSIKRRRHTNVHKNSNAYRLLRRPFLCISRFPLFLPGCFANLFPCLSGMLRMCCCFFPPPPLLQFSRITRTMRQQRHGERPHLACCWWLARLYPSGCVITQPARQCIPQGVWLKSPRDWVFWKVCDYKVHDIVIGRGVSLQSLWDILQDVKNKAHEIMYSAGYVTT